MKQCTRWGDKKYTKSSAYCGYVSFLTFAFPARAKSFLASSYKNSKFDANFGEKSSQKKMQPSKSWKTECVQFPSKIYNDAIDARI